MAADQGKLRLGVIGAGFIAQVAHLHAFKRVDNVEVVAIAEPHDGLREAVARRHGIRRAVADYRDLLASDDVDAIVVSLPRRAQSGVVREAVAAKRAILSEKPVAMTVAGAEGLVAAAETNQTRWAVGYMKRHDRGVGNFAARLRDLVADGTWGQIIDVEMRDFCATYGVPIPEHVRRDGPRPVRFEEGAPAPDFVAADLRGAYDYTVNVASHDINLFRLLFGDDLSPVSMHVRPGGAQRAVLDTGAFTISLTLGPADIGRWDQQLSVTFEKGRATLVLPSPLARQESAVIVLTHQGRTEEIRIHPKDHVWAFEAQARAFTDSALTGAPLESTGADALADLRLIEGLWKTVDWHQ